LTARGRLEEQRAALDRVHLALEDY